MPAKRPLETLFQAPWSRGVDHAALTATTTVKLFTVPTGKTLRIDRVWYCNPTGLAGAAGNAFKGEVKNGSTVINTMFNTDTGAGGASLAADTPGFGTNSATDASLVLAAGDVLTLVFTETGTATLPAGSLFIEGRYV